MASKLHLITPMKYEIYAGQVLEEMQPLAVETLSNTYHSLVFVIDITGDSQ